MAPEPLRERGRHLVHGFPGRGEVVGEAPAVRARALQTPPDLAGGAAERTCGCHGARELEALIRPLAEPYRELAALTGVSHVAVAGLVGHAGDLGNLRSADAFAMRSGTAPVPCSSGRNQRMRLNHRGDRQLNRLLYVIAMVQIRFAAHPGRVYYQRKLQEGKTPRVALRALKRRLATVVYYRLLADTAALAPPDAAASATLAA